MRALQRNPDAALLRGRGRRRSSSAVSRSHGTPTRPARHVADLGLMVAESHRRRGIGRALLEQAVAWARDAEVRKLELHVFPWNEPAIALYETFGFEREGLRRDHYVATGKMSMRS